MLENSEVLHEIFRTKEYSRSYAVTYVAEIRHLGLGSYRILKDKDQGLLHYKIESQFNKWDENWARIVNKNQSLASKEANFNLAEERTRNAQDNLEQIENILLESLEIDHSIDWNTLKNTKKFTIPNPKNLLEKELRNILVPESPSYKSLPIKPDVNHFQPKLSFLDKIITSRASKKQDIAEAAYNNAILSWKELVRQIETYNSSLDEKNTLLIKELDREKDEIRNKYDLLEKEWEIEKSEYLLSQEEHNNKIDNLRELYFQKDTNAVMEYCELVLNNSEYPDTFPKNFDLDYNPENRLLIIEYALPAPENFPKLSEVKYILSKKELKEIFITDTQLAKIYDNAIYNICLRTLHEIFESDKVDAFDLVVFNGRVETINKATGKKINNCIVSIQAKKDDFLQIELANIDPKVCFKALKGISSNKLIGITSIQPLIQVNRNDKRFVSSYDVANTLDEGYNLASMDWEDFEHLIRELFAKEFSSTGGEVKVTRASRDGGVDAVAFDPDPIRGGKIVIQAKRYSNTVGVSAVRDLYGTVMNEGATKGILVSTADYGSDAYEFAKNKPLTLLNGSNLLFLLEKHGHKARIDLAEAKKAQSGIS